LSGSFAVLTQVSPQRVSFGEHFGMHAVLPGSDVVFFGQARQSALPVFGW
jgi:hypothetical protein